MTRKQWLILLFGTILTILALKAFAFTAIELKEVAFSYRPEAEPFYVEETTKIRNQNNGYINKRQELELYKKVSQDITKNMDLKAWSAKGGAAPKQFQIRVRVKNYGSDASKQTPVTVTVYAKVGEYLVDPKTFMVDLQHLRQSAKWEPLTTLNGTIPVLAQNEAYDFYAQPVQFAEWLQLLEHRFPVELKATAYFTSPSSGKTISIPVNADHFALDDLNRSTPRQGKR